MKGFLSFLKETFNEDHFEGVLMMFFAWLSAVFLMFLFVGSICLIIAAVIAAPLLTLSILSVAGLSLYFFVRAVMRA